MPRYFHEAIYNQKARKTQAKAVTQSQRQVLVRHHLSTLRNPTLIINTYVVPVLYMIMLGVGAVFLKDLGPDYFGLMLLVGVAFGLFSAQPTSFLGVATSLEGTNLTLFVACQSILVTIFVKSFGFSMACKSVFPSY